MVHVAPVVMVTVLPFVPVAVQTAGVTELKMIGNPDAPPVAVAVTVPPMLTEFGVKANNDMAWLPLSTTMFCVTWVAEL
jgi:hypothetical protein